MRAAESGASGDGEGAGDGRGALGATTALADGPGGTLASLDESGAGASLDGAGVSSADALAAFPTRQTATSIATILGAIFSRTGDDDRALLACSERMIHSPTTALTSHPAPIAKARLSVVSVMPRARMAKWVKTWVPAPRPSAYARSIHLPCAAYCLLRSAATPSTRYDTIVAPTIRRIQKSAAPSCAPGVMFAVSHVPDNAATSPAEAATTPAARCILGWRARRPGATWKAPIVENAHALTI